MKTSVKKFLAAALVMGALFGAGSSQAADWDHGNNEHRSYNQGNYGHDRDSYRDNERYHHNQELAYRHERPMVRSDYRYYGGRPQYSYYQPHFINPERFLIGFNF